MIKQSIALFAVLTFANANFHLHKGEKLLYGLKCKNDKEMGLVLGKDSKYLQYRYGKVGKVEFEYPKNKRATFKHFIYSNYFRAGAGNAGLDLQYLRFTNHHILYLIYDEYNQETKARDFGIKVIKNGKLLTNIVCKSYKGSLQNISALPVKKDSKTEFTKDNQ